MSVTDALKRFVGIVAAGTAIAAIIFAIGSAEVRVLIALAYVVFLSAMVALLPGYITASDGLASSYAIDTGSALRHPKE